MAAWGRGGGPVRLRRGLRMALFVVMMVASLVVVSVPVVVVVGDVLVPSALIPSFTCLGCYGLREHWRRYGFRSSLVDIPLVSIVRSFVITCVYCLSDEPGLSHGPYLGTATFCSLISILILSVKACVFVPTSEFDVEVSSSLARQKLHLKKSWGMPVLFLSSLVFALGHVVAAYQTSCKARRKLLLHGVDPESVLSCRKQVYRSYLKSPRSTTSSHWKFLTSEIGAKKKLIPQAFDRGVLPVRMLVDADSLFLSYQGLRLHYKLSIPESHLSCSSATISCLKDYPTKIIRHPLKVPSETHQCYIVRSFSNKLQSSSSLYAPLLFTPSASLNPSFLEEIPASSEVHASIDSALPVARGQIEAIDGTKKFGVVLVHGFGGGVFSWRHIMGLLSQQIGCTVAAFDRPGWGLTSRLQRKDWENKQLQNPYKLEFQVDLLLSFCLEMGLSSVVLVGHDDGGLLVLKAVERSQTSAKNAYVEIKGVVLVSVNLSREVVSGFARILLHTSLGRKHMIRPLLRTEITQVVNRRAWYDATKLTTEVLNLYKAPLCIEGWDEALQEISRLSHANAHLAQNATALLKSVEDLPVLVVAGAEDAFVSLKSSQAMASKFTNSRLVAIFGCGHLPHEECPKILLEALSPFITRLLT